MDEKIHNCLRRIYFENNNQIKTRSFVPNSIGKLYLYSREAQRYCFIDENATYALLISQVIQSEERIQKRAFASF